MAAGLVFCTGPFAAAMQARNSQGYLGVILRDVTEDQAVPLKLREARGTEIIAVDHDGPACKAGLQLHDVIVQMNGQAIEGGEQLRRILHEIPAGRQVTLIVSRDGQEKTISARLGDREELEKQAWEQHYIVPDPDEGGSSSSTYTHVGNGFFRSGPSAATTGALKGTHGLLGTTMIVSAAYTGAKLEVMGPQLAEFFGAQGSAGLLVRSVDPDSPAASAGMKAGDVVVKVNSVPVTSGTEWAKTIHENRGKPVSVVVLREKKERTLTLTPDAKKRSSLDDRNGIEEFFGYGDGATETRATLAELEPMFNQLADTLESGLAPQRLSPEMMAMLEQMQRMAGNHETLEGARMQLHMAAMAMRRQMESPVFCERRD
jgi:membrane-associated protease RseP (regulator of RpoE activity)